MLPRWHILYGTLFTALLWIAAPGTPWRYLFLVWFASIFIDVDHYVCAVRKTGKLSLLKAFSYHGDEEQRLQKMERRGLKPKGDFHLFHTLEFHVLVAIAGVFWSTFFYLFVGMMFHSLLDLFTLIKTEKLHRREYFFFTWLRKKI